MGTFDDLPSSEKHLEKKVNIKEVLSEKIKTIMELCSNCICLRGLKRNIHNMDNEENSETTLTTRTTTMTKSYITINVPWLLRASLLILALTTTPSNAIPLYLPSIAEELDLATNNNRTTLSPYEKLLNEEPKWHNPCGTRALQEVPQFNGVSFSNSRVVEPPKESDLMDGIISIARVALRQSRYFKEDYVSLFDFYNLGQFFKEYLI